MQRGVKLLCTLGVVAAAVIGGESNAWCDSPTERPEPRGTVPTFVLHTQGRGAGGEHDVVLLGRDPRIPGLSTVKVELVPVTLRFSAGGYILPATPYVRAVSQSPIFKLSRFGSGAKRQFVDALLAASIPGAQVGHTALSIERVRPVSVAVPPSRGYVLTSDHGGERMAVVDEEYVQRQVFDAIGPVRNTLIIAFTENTTYFAAGDATICCSWGTHGVDARTGDSFVLSTYLSGAPDIVEDKDIQPITSQLAELTYNPLFDPTDYLHKKGSSNSFQAWRSPGSTNRPCAGTGPGSNYFFLEPTSINQKNQFPHSSASLVTTRDRGYHVANVALLSWYLRAPDSSQHWSFPDANALTSAPQPCSTRRAWLADAHTPVHHAGRSWRRAGKAANASAKHWMIGYYWLDPDTSESQLDRLVQLANEWNVVIISFAAPVPGGADGDMRLKVPNNWRPAELAQVIRQLQSEGKNVLLSLGGGGEYFKLDHVSDVPRFVSSVSSIVKKYGFNGIDLDFETPSLELQPGDNDFREPTTPAVVNLITGLRQLKSEFGVGFMISIVPEGPQVNAALVTYGGQFGSELPIIYALRNELSFVDVQEYNTPPLEGLDGEIYQAHNVDYIASMTELLLHGFNIDRDPRKHFPALLPDKVAVGFLVSYDKPSLPVESFRYLTTNRPVSGVHYKLRLKGGYPLLRGLMFWNMQGDAAHGREYSSAAWGVLHKRPSRDPVGASSR